MDELKVGEWVLSASRENGMVYSRVESWMHRVPDEEREFLRLTLDDGKELKLTRGHFIYRTQCSGAVVSGELKAYADVFRQSPVLAKELRAGDCMFAVDETSPTGGLFERRIESIENVAERGFYAPLTGNGNIIVDGILSSCYNEIDQDVLQQTAFGLFASMKDFFGGLFGESADDNKVELPMGLEMLMKHVIPYVLPTKVL